MGIVGDYLREVIKRQVEEKGIVVWFDPEGHYGAFAQALALPETSVACYDGSFFALRHHVAPLLEGERAPRLVVYVPLAEERTHDALIELTCAGTVIKPGQNPRQRNTRLAVIARGALKERVGEEQMRAIEKQIDGGQLGLDDLDRASGQGFPPGVLAIIYGTGDPHEIALQFLSSDVGDAEVVKRHAEAELARQVQDLTGAALPAEERLAQWRTRVARHVLCTEFLASLRGAPPQSLAGIPVSTDPAARTACIQLARRWRLRRDTGESYALHANRVERELSVARLSFALDQMRACETFAAVEDALQSAVESALIDHAIDRAIDEPLALARRRRGGFWPTQLPEVQARWALITTAAELLGAAAAIETSLREADRSASGVLADYTEGEHPWCELDTLHREMEYRSRKFDFGQKHGTLERLLARARRRYMEVASAVAESFVSALQKTRFHVEGFGRQAEIYAKTVAPALREGKTAYVLVDALRFEMARTLLRTVGDGYAVELSAAVGTVPTITPIGMAALMPEAQARTGAQVQPVGGVKLGLAVGTTVLKDRKGRMDWIKAHAGLGQNGSVAKVCDLTLEQLLPPAQSSPAIKEAIKRADLVVVTSQEIDQICESDNLLLAHGALDDILTNLARAIHRLAEAGCTTIVVTADHGFVFGDELDSAMKLDPPGGQTIELHRRVWVGRGGAANPAAYLRARLADFGLSDDGTLEIAVPWGFGAFKVQGGARAYFHGGMSPQEMAIPVATLTAKALAGGAGGSAASEIGWELALSSKKISARFCSVRVGGRNLSFFGGAALCVRVEVRRDREVLSRPVSASYGFVEATGNVQMQFAEDAERALVENTIALHLTEAEAGRTIVSIHLVDAATGFELKRLEGVELALTF